MKTWRYNSYYKGVGEKEIQFEFRDPYAEIMLFTGGLVEIRFFSRKSMKQICHSRPNIIKTKKGKIVRMNKKEFFDLISEKMDIENSLNVQKAIFETL